MHYFVVAKDMPRYDKCAKIQQKLGNIKYRTDYFLHKSNKRQS